MTAEETTKEEMDEALAAVEETAEEEMGESLWDMGEVAAWGWVTEGHERHE